MRKIFLYSVFSFFVLSAKSQWSTTGTLAYTTDYVGIGTSTPAYSLDVLSADNSIGNGIRLANTVSSGVSAPGSIPVVEVLGARGDGNNSFGGRLALGGRRTDGTPLSTQILGWVCFGGQYGTSTTFQSSEILYPASIAGVAEGSFTAAGTMPTAITFLTGTTGNNVRGPNLNYGTERMRITNYGTVLIGKTSQTNTSYLLDVAGNVRTNELVVNTTGADFVFDSTYRLASLSAVEDFIHKQHHLPGIEPAEKMQQEGMNIGNLETCQLQKIEELTLYVIAQNKELEALKKENERLKEQNEQWEARIARLEKLVNEKAVN